ncbi:MAG: cytochrome c peroxidase [Myxococcota bacterium]
MAPRPSTLSVAAVLERAKEHFSPLPEAAESRSNPITQAKVDLGRMLYFDKRLSKNHDLACASCHDLGGFGVDIREDGGQRAKTSSGHKGQKGDRNTPTVYNAGLYLAQFWDGRAKNLEEQAKGPVTNPVEMAMADETAVVNTLTSIPGYVEAFAKAFPEDIDPVDYDNMALAIGAFERQLMTPGPFDDFLSGKLTALDEKQLAGLDLFLTADCVQCHTGPALGGTMYKKLGIVKAWEGLEDPGRGKLTKKPDDEHVFKVPSLRNITKTGPYLHDGSIADLETMVQKMATHQLAKGELSPDEMTAMIAFLGSLEGRLPTEYIAAPTLPESGPETPAADPT